MKGFENAVCSLTGRKCKCSIGKGCGRGVVDPTANEALLWARTSILRLQDAAEALDLAVDELVYERPFPGPEWRDKVRRINQLIDELEKETNR